MGLVELGKCRVCHDVESKVDIPTISVRSLFGVSLLWSKAAYAAGPRPNFKIDRSLGRRLMPGGEIKERVGLTTHQTDF